jgi:uncharacterized protein YydD (DUF2326 family)
MIQKSRNEEMQEKGNKIEECEAVMKSSRLLEDYRAKNSVSD